ncbi:putative matrix protein [Serpentovirinae sp. isolate K48]|uniref:Matrix protein n=1 Tax=Serpentovirinae sp. isolate K48 TaxID=3071292 RepID=A0AAE6NYM1_9NIDO|nr:putative matrix protein [Serpentovirinae sp.]QFU19757.1 putative matrix protein [Serpentovirinae sp.]
MAINDYLTKLHSNVVDYTAAWVSMKALLVVSSWVIIITFCLALCFKAIPTLRSYSLLSTSYRLLQFFKTVIIVAFFYITNRAEEQSTLFMTIFILITIILLLKLLYWVFSFLFMLVKYRSFNLALAGSPSFVIDGKAYPADCYSPVLAFVRTVSNGKSDVKFGEHCLTQLPELVAYISYSRTVTYRFQTVVQDGNTKVHVWHKLNSNVQSA